MAAQQLITYGDIVTSILEKLGIQQTDPLANAKINRAVNEVYLDEVIPFKPWVWLEKSIQVVHNPAYITGTVETTQGSSTITFDTPPSAGLGSFLNYRFASNGADNETTQVYYISAHTAGSGTATLSTPFQEPNVVAGTFYVWRDRFDLPLNARETVKLWHNGSLKACHAVGPKEFRDLEAQDPVAQGYPLHYNTWEYFDPTTSGDDETVANRFRQTRIHPSINETQQGIILNVDYVENATALQDPLDEPLIPINDRIVLFYGALAIGYSALARDEDMHDRYWSKFMTKLARMAGNRDEGQDTPLLSPKARYMNQIRKAGLRRSGFGGGF